MPLYNPSADLNAIQSILISDTVLLELMGLTGQQLINKANNYIKKNPSTPLEKAKNLVIAHSIIKRKQWTDLADSNERLCVYFIPARRIRNESFFEEVLEIDCHVPATYDYKAWQIQERIFKLLHKKKVNNRYLYADPPLGELPTMSGFFCCGSRYKFYRNI